MPLNRPPKACNRCRRDLAPDGDVFEAQEAIQIDFLTGYASVFGDCNRVHGLFCQHCLHELLGPYLRTEPLQDDQTQANTP